MKRIITIVVVCLAFLCPSTAQNEGRAYYDALARKVIPSGNLKRVVKQPSELIVIAQNYVDSVILLKGKIDETQNDLDKIIAIDSLVRFRAAYYLDIKDLHNMYESMSLEEEQQKSYEKIAKKIGWQINPNYVYTPKAKKQAKKGYGNLTGNSVYYKDGNPFR